MDRLQRIMLSNGLLIILAAMFAGFMLMFSLLGGIEIWPGYRVPLHAALLKRWVLGTHHGAVDPRHVDYYLDEFAFRFNRREACCSID